MYPLEILDLFPAFPRTNMLFVAMSFDHEFDSLYDEVIKPAAEQTMGDGAALFAHRVDLGTKSDAIMAEVVRYIAECRLVLADISTVGWMEARPPRGRRPIRNANVMYELGLAHAARLPEEVILLRSDSDELDFDLRGVRVHSYALGDRIGQIAGVRTLLEEALKATDQRRQFAVEIAARSLTPAMWMILHSLQEIPHPTLRGLQDFPQLEQLDAIQPLLAAGLLAPNYKPLPVNFMERPASELFTYYPTHLGRIVYGKAREKMKFNDAMFSWISTEAGRAWLHRSLGEMGAPMPNPVGNTADGNTPASSGDPSPSTSEGP